jgi:hypothetical protein
MCKSLNNWFRREWADMNPEGQIPRSRGAVCGVLLIILGLWGGLAPFVGPYFHFGYTPDTHWHWSMGRLYFSVIPAAAALLSGILVLVTRNRGVGIVAGLLGALGGAWFVVGSAFVTYVLKMSIAVGGPIVSAGSTPLRSYLEQIGLFTGVGLLILFLGSIAIGRFSMLAASDVAASADGSSYADSPIASRYSTSASSFPTSAGHFPSGRSGGSSTATAQYPDETGQYPNAPTSYPETTTTEYPQHDSGS